MNIKISSQNIPKVRLIDALSLIRNGMNIKQGVVDGGLPITRIETISNGEICLEKVGYAGLEKIDSSEYILKEGDILFSHINSPTHLGKTAIYYKDQHGDLIHGMNLLCLRANQEKVYPKYLNYAINAPAFKSQLPKITKKAVNQASIAIADLKELEITLPPLPEQKRIAAILDKADSLRRKNQQAIQLADKFLRAVFLDMFGDPVTNPKGWETKKLKEMASKIGSGATPRGGQSAYVDHGISLIRSLNIHDDKFLHKDLAFITDQQADALSNVEVRKNDVLLNITGASVCRCAMVDKSILPARVNQHVCIIRPTELLPEYLLHVIISKSYKQHLLKIAGAAGATREALTKEQVENLFIPIPPLALQERFSQIKQRVKLIATDKTLVDKLPLFESLSQKAFAGEL